MPQDLFQRHPQPPHSSSSPRFSLHVEANFTGPLASSEGRGAIALYYLKRKAGGGRVQLISGLALLQQPLSPTPSPLLMALSLSKCASRQAPLQPWLPCPLALDSQAGSSPHPEAQPVPTPHGEAAHTRVSKHVLCVCPQARALCPTMPGARGIPRTRDPVQNLCLAFPLETQTYSSGQLWDFCLLCRIFVVAVVW